MMTTPPYARLQHERDCRYALHPLPTSPQALGRSARVPADPQRPPRRMPVTATVSGKETRS